MKLGRDCPHYRSVHAVVGTLASRDYDSYHLLFVALTIGRGLLEAILPTTSYQGDLGGESFTGSATTSLDGCSVVSSRRGINGLSTST